jgi:hypothetical protein
MTRVAIFSPRTSFLLLELAPLNICSYFENADAHKGRYLATS